MSRHKVIALSAGLAILSIACGLTTTLPSANPPSGPNEQKVDRPSTDDSQIVSANEMQQAILRVDLPPVDESDWQIRTGLLAADFAVNTIGLRDFRLGDRDVFVIDDGSLSGRDVEASLHFVSEHAYFWIADGISLNAEDIRRVASRFESEVFKPVRDIFGTDPAPGIDGDPRIHILHAADLGDDILAYVMPSDRYSQDVIAASNQRELIYVNVDLIARFADDLHIRTLAHEFEHILQGDVDPNEGNWTDEGLAQVAERIAGFDDLVERYDFLARTDTPLDYWPATEDNFPNYGSSYLFYLYLWEQLGEPTFSRIATNSRQGLQAISDTLADSNPELTLERLFANWSVANVANDPTIAEGQFGYRTSDVGNVCPLQRLSSNPYKRSSELAQYTATYYQIDGTGPLTLSFEGNPLALLIPNQQANSRGMWWSMQGDNSNPRLTRRVDLSGTTQATLEFSLWHDLEDDFDTGYISVSTDGGTSWQVLSGQTSAPETSYYALPAFTGKSGNGSEAVWVQEEINLNRYAGHTILLRFEVITDTSFTAPGMAIADIAIPEIGFHDSAQTPDDAWLAEGWLFAGNVVPQHWNLYIVTEGAQTEVMEIALEEGHMARWTGTLPADSQQATLVIAASAPAATSLAQYTLALSGKFSTQNEGTVAGRCG